MKPLKTLSIRGDKAMGTNYKDIDAKCPFYLSSETSEAWSSICCEGIGTSNRLKFQFKGKSKRDAYKKSHCDCNYKSCLIEQMLESKYDEKGEEIGRSKKGVLRKGDKPYQRKV